MTSLKQKTAMAMVSIFFVAGLAAIPAAAQDATPEAAAECLETTLEENEALVTDLIAAGEAGDADTIDAILADEMIYEVNRYGLENDDTTNDDDIALIMALEEFYPGSTTTVVDTIAEGNQVVAIQVLTIPAHTMTGEMTELDEALEIDQILIYTIECGEIVHIDGVSDEYSLFVGLGLLAPLGGGDEATPEA